jgi:hypothetical protein
MSAAVDRLFMPHWAFATAGKVRRVRGIKFVKLEIRKETP